MHLTTERLRLTPMTTDDAAWLHELWTLAEVRQYLWDDVIISREQTREILNQSQQAHQQGQYGLFAMTTREEGKPIGFTGYWPFFEPPQIQLIFGLHPDHWRKGLVHEAAAAMITYGKDTLGMAVILAATDPPNMASIRVMERLGMRFTEKKVQDGKETLFYEI